MTHESEIPNCIVEHMPALSSRDFVRRGTEIQHLFKWYDEATKGDTYRAILVSGLGGIGKSVIVRQFLNELKEKEDEPNVNLVFLKCGESDYKQSVLEFISKFKVKKCLSSLQYVMNSLSKSRPTILVIDNLEKMFDELIGLIYSDLPHLYTIVTSRDKCIIDGSIRMQKIQHLKKEDIEESERFFTQNVGTQLNKTDIESLCDSVHYFPLTLVEAANYIRMKKRIYMDETDDLLDFQEDFRCLTKQRDILAKNFPQRFQNVYNATTFTTWDKTLQDLFKADSKLIPQIALLMLRILSFGKSHGLLEEHLHNLSNLHLLGNGSGWRFLSSEIDSFEFSSPIQQYQQADIKEAIELLARYSFLEREKPNSWNMNKMLQVVSKLKHVNQGYPSESFLSENKDAADALSWVMFKS